MDTTFLNGKTVLVTGGTGTFGRAFIKRALQVQGVKKIILFRRDELKQSEVQAALADTLNYWRKAKNTARAALFRNQDPQGKATVKANLKSGLDRASESMRAHRDEYYDTDIEYVT